MHIHTHMHPTNEYYHFENLMGYDLINHFESIYSICHAKLMFSIWR